ncbi:MAG: alpha/beta hydrolase [Enterococcus lacertideformus]|uniref:Alpha/beta hydrolase n=1 Tax=Enterococcus lacertideformus TaxID=2771493 RepID=A0A931AWI5_9ENTE|nr:alpha/beta hydrolase [Enterococcus lacertideformus]
MKSLPKSFYEKHSKRAVLLLHAYSGSPNDVRMLARYLEKLEYTVYAPLFTGHGTLNPEDILSQKAETWWEYTKQAVQFLETEGYSQIAVFGLSMGGIFAVRALEEQQMIGGGFFCSPISPVETHVSENFERYERYVLKTAGESEQTIEEIVATLRPKVHQQLAEIQKQAAITEGNLDKIQTPIFLAQAGQDEMIDPLGVYETAKKLIDKRLTLQWYPNSKHVITVGESRRLLEKDVLEFLEKLPWNEESI